MRNSQLDIAKGIGIIFVVLGHNWITLHDKAELFRIIFSFHMALFFCIAGVFIKKETSLADFIKTKADALLKPYFVVLLLAAIFRFCTEQIKSKGAENLKLDQFLGIFFASGPTIIWGHLWFLPHLFISTLVAFLIIKAIGARGSWYLLGIAMLSLTAGAPSVGAFWNLKPYYLGAVAMQAPSGLPWSIDLLPVTTGFVLAGYCSRQYIFGFKINLKILMATIITFFALHFYFDETMDLMLRVYGNPIICMMQALCAIYIILSASSLLIATNLASKVLTYIGQGSLFILIFHGIIQMKIYTAIGLFLPNPYLCGLISLFFGIAAPLLLWEISKRSGPLRQLLLPTVRRNAAKLRPPSLSSTV